MKNGNRKFVEEGVMHVYQRAVNGFNIFYTQHDYIVFYTIFSVFVRRFDICALSLCLMIDHFHVLLISESKVCLSRFISSVTSLYARLFNETVGRKGQLFDKSFGSAPKVSEKQVRTAVPYVFNNPVEKWLSMDPLDYRWNFMAYMSSDYPFSKKLSIREASSNLRNAVKEVKACHAGGLWLNYTQLDRLYRYLSLTERDQLTDFIIQAYNPFDKEKLMSYYKSYDMMLLAVRSITGAEYDIREEFNKLSDRLYLETENYIKDKLSLDPKSLLVLSADEKVELAKKIGTNTKASPKQIAKYLHLLPKDKVLGNNVLQEIDAP